MNDPSLLIDFIGIGAPKCGTTWLSTQLEAHPQIGFAPDKEVYYFADTIMRRIAHKELGRFERGMGWYHEQFPPADGQITCRGEFCPAYLYSEQAAERIAAYRPDIKLLLCLRPPVEMIYSWYWYNRNAVVATLPETFSAMMEDPFLRDLGCYAHHLRPYLQRFPPESILVIQFEAIRREPARVRAETYEFLGVDAHFEPQLAQQGQNAARAPRFPLLQSSAQKVYETVSGFPVAGKVLKSAIVARTLQGVYHRLNSKARKYEPLSPEDKSRWESYYTEDQAELAAMLRNLRVIA